MNGGRLLYGRLYLAMPHNSPPQHCNGVPRRTGTQLLRGKCFVAWAAKEVGNQGFWPNI